MAAPISRRQIAQGLCDMLENGASPKKIGQILAAYLIENKITRDQDLFLRDLRRELTKRFGLASVDVKSASKLTDGVADQIEDFIKKQTGAKDVEIINSIDESLVAGVVISTTDAELDNSVKSKVRKLRTV